MCRKGKELSIRDRYFIEKSLKRNMSHKEIAEVLGVTRQCIDYEVKKGIVLQRDTHLKEVSVYKADYAQAVHDNLKKTTGRKCEYLESEVLEEVIEKIKNGDSPYAALQRIKAKEMCVKTVYNYFHQGRLGSLRYTDFPYMSAKKRRTEKRIKKAVSYDNSIECRPKEVLRRKKAFDWEMDTVYSGKGSKEVLLVLTERKTRSEICKRLPNRGAEAVASALTTIETKLGTQTFREVFHSITCDNGIEFSDCVGIEKSRFSNNKKTKLYYCHPYTSSERGSNENQNKMIRRKIPKGDDISLYSEKDIKHINTWINTYPREIFKGKSSYDMLCREYILGNISQKGFEKLRELTVSDL